MAINLNTPNGFDGKSTEYQRMLESLQGNILKSHARDHVRLLFLQFTGDEDAIKKWISELKVTSSMDQLIASGFRELNPEHDGGLIVNFFLSAEGYEELDFDIRSLCKNGNRIFGKGMKSKRARKLLNDPPLTDWEEKYTEDIDAMILLADDDKHKSRLNREIDEMKESLTDIADIISEETGAGLPDGIEHFGYRDGVSNPRYFKKDIEKEAINRGGIDKWNPAAPLDIILIKDPFTDKQDNNYGSFLVYRKLEQDVDGFNKRVIDLAKNLNLNQNQKTNNVTTEEFAGALAVGRFKDGTPLVLSDSPKGQAPVPNNFEYKDGDQKGLKCPFHAHIRKTNPRGQGALVPERFITRRAIPYGKQNKSNEKGLLFMCFQSDLKKQFNFMQKTWANNPKFPPFRDKPGIDPLIGQGDKGSQEWPKSYNDKKDFDFDFGGFISMKGGEYFFAPSIGFLKNIDKIKST